jgi:hypothetical protein
MHEGPLCYFDGKSNNNNSTMHEGPLCYLDRSSVNFYKEFFPVAMCYHIVDFSFQNSREECTTAE